MMNDTNNQGHFNRKESLFRNWITQDGTAGISGIGGFTPEKNRYHLYVSLACPWANRTLIMRNLKGLQDFIPTTVVHWRMGRESWHFKAENGAEKDPLYDAQFLSELYHRVDPHYDEQGGVVTVPLLWDKKNNTVVSNESSEIIRMFNSAFDEVGALKGDYYPENLRSEIDAMNDRLYNTINNGVYRCGFATTQEAYDLAYFELFETLDFLENYLKDKHFLIHNQLTEADIRLFVTLVRFDAVYYSHFKCNKKQIRNYPEIWRYLRELYAKPEFQSTINMFHIKHHYYESHKNLNPSGIVPIGPEIDFSL